jgi:hypothetical protein
MNTSRLMLATLLATGTALAQPSEQPATPAKAEESTTIASKIENSSSDDPAKLSTETSKLVTAGLPKFNPNQPPPQPKHQPNPDVLELDKMTITQRPRPRLDPQVVMSRNDFNETLAKQRLSHLDRNGLNKFTLPLFGRSAAERAREEYDREKNATMRTDVLSLAKAVEVENPEQAAELRKAVNR